MYLGEYTAGDTIWAVANLSNFQTGEIEAGVITAFRLLVGAAWASRVAVTFSSGPFEAGVYNCELDTTGYASGMWVIQAHVTVDLVEVTTTYYFRIT